MSEGDERERRRQGEEGAGEREGRAAGAGGAGEEVQSISMRVRCVRGVLESVRGESVRGRLSLSLMYIRVTKP